MQVVVQPTPTMDFEFSVAKTSAYFTAPSSPERFGEYYLSAPTSPSRISQFYREFDYFSTLHAHSASSSDNHDGDDGFAFYVSQESETSSLTAEELFDGGKIKPFNPPPQLEVDQFTSLKTPLLSSTQPESPISQGKKKLIRDAFSPKKRKDSEPFARAADSTRREETEQRRGRETTPAVLSSSSSGRRATRSHSPYRVSHYTWDEEKHQQNQSTKQELSSSTNSTASLSTTSSSKSSRKWKFSDFLLFRSASEGRGSSKDPFRKYSFLYKRPGEVKNSSFRSIDSPTSAPGSRRRGPISAHEFHYAMKKAESEDLKKKTFLPYKQGILGRLAGLGSFTR